MPEGEGSGTGRVDGIANGVSPWACRRQEQGCSDGHQGGTREQGSQRKGWKAVERDNEGGCRTTLQRWALARIKAREEECVSAVRNAQARGLGWHEVDVDTSEVNSFAHPSPRSEACENTGKNLPGRFRSHRRLRGALARVSLDALAGLFPPLRLLA